MLWNYKNKSKKKNKSKIGKMHKIMIKNKVFNNKIILLKIKILILNKKQKNILNIYKSKIPINNNYLQMNKCIMILYFNKYWRKKNKNYRLKIKNISFNHRQKMIIIKMIFNSKISKTISNNKFKIAINNQYIKMNK